MILRIVSNKDLTALKNCTGLSSSNVHPPRLNSRNPNYGNKNRRPNFIILIRRVYDWFEVIIAGKAVCVFNNFILLLNAICADVITISIVSSGPYSQKYYTQFDIYYCFSVYYNVFDLTKNIVCNYFIGFTCSNQIFNSYQF